MGFYAICLGVTTNLIPTIWILPTTLSLPIYPGWHSSALLLVSLVMLVLTELNLIFFQIECENPPLRGIESLLRHYNEQHKDIDGNNFPFPPGFSQWKPISFPQYMVSHGLLVGANPEDQAFSCLTLSQVEGLGTVLVGSIAPKRFHLLSSQGLFSASQGTLPPSQGSHSMARRKRTKARQLEKVQLGQVLRGKDEDEEGNPTVILADLGSFGPRHQSNDKVSQQKKRSSRGWLGAKPQLPDQGERGKVELARQASASILFGQQCHQLSVGLSSPQPEPHNSEDIGGRWTLNQVSKSILFDVLENKVDEMERLGLIDASLM